MMATTFVGTLLSALALYSLASPDGGGSLLDLFSDGGVDGEEAESAMRFFSSENVGAFLSSLRASSGNVASVALPGAPSDIAALTLGEGVSGFVSSTLVFQVKNYMMRMMKKETSNDSARNLSNGYSNGEYFAARGLAQGLGVPALGSVLFAVIPSTFAKMDERIKNKREINDKLMDELLEDSRKNQNPIRNFLKKRIDNEKRVEDILEEKNNNKIIDTVELSADITKWLEFEILQKDLGSKIIPSNIALESGIFGFVASLSALMYIDFCYKYLRLGDEREIEKVDNRSLRDTIAKYFENAISSFFLFGIYSGLRLPIQKKLLEAFSGGIDSCLGSADYNLCSEIFLEENTPEAGVSIKEQATGVVRFFFELFSRVDGDFDVNEATTRVVHFLHLGTASL